ncbi:MAG: sugar-binding transcriptional regulator [Lacisediminihabitans sp.]
MREAVHARRSHVSLEAAVVARRYFIDGKQKNEIADDLGISRFKVARLLDDARAQGIVRIQVDLPIEVDLPSSDALAAAYGISRAIVVRTLAGSTDEIGALIGAAAADYLSGVVDADDVLGVSWGVGLTHVVDAVTSLAACEVVQLVGGVQTADMNVTGVELLRRLAQKNGGKAFPLHVPLMLRSSAVARGLRDDPSLEPTIERFGRISVALVGIGSWRPPHSALYREMPQPERESILAEGAVGDVCTFVFDDRGRLVQSEILDRTMGIGLEELRRVPKVIAVAGGPEKVDAIAAVLKSGLVNVLVTDAGTARELLVPTQ